MKAKVKFIKEYQGLFNPGEEMSFAKEVAEYIVGEGYAEFVKAEPKPKPKPAPKKK